jgi:hypothetical protein
MGGAYMPRKKREELNYAGFILNRTVGLEIEGYSRTNPRRITGIPYCQIKRDGSLHNAHWSDSYSMYGVEFVTEPLHDLAPLGEVFEAITSYGWSASGRASLHIHVSAGDFTFHDKLKMAHFAKQIEDIMFLFVKNRRYKNRYCQMIPEIYKTIIHDRNRDVANAQSMNSLMDAINRSRGAIEADQVYLGRYRWVNIFHSHYSTIEFRLFHPIRKAEDGAKFAMLCHNFVNLVKNSTLEQLEFIAQSIIEESNIELKAKKLLDSLGIDFDIPVINNRAARELSLKQQREAVRIAATV